MKQILFAVFVVFKIYICERAIVVFNIRLGWCVPTNCKTEADNIGPSCTSNPALRDCSKASLRRIKVPIIIDNCWKKERNRICFPFFLPFGRRLEVDSVHTPWRPLTDTHWINVSKYVLEFATAMFRAMRKKTSERISTFILKHVACRYFEFWFLILLLVIIFVDGINRW